MAKVMQCIWVDFVKIQYNPAVMHLL